MIIYPHKLGLFHNCNKRDDDFEISRRYNIKDGYLVCHIKCGVSIPFILTANYLIWLYDTDSSYIVGPNKPWMEDIASIKEKAFEL